MAKPETDADLARLTYLCTGIRIADNPYCPHHVSPFKAFADAYFCRSPIAVWHASRGFGGKSLQLATLSIVEAIFQGASVSLLGGSGEQSARVHSYVTGQDTNLPNTFWTCPTMPYDVKQLLMDDKPTKRETRLANGGRISVLMASQTSVRGPHPNKLRLDECFFGETLITMGDLSKKKIIDILVGDSVIGVDDTGAFNVYNVNAFMDKGIRKTIKIALSNGSELVCTPRQKIMTRSGWAYAEQIQRGDVVVAVSEKLYKMRKGVWCKSEMGEGRDENWALQAMLLCGDSDREASLSYLRKGEKSKCENAQSVLCNCQERLVSEVCGLQQAVEAESHKEMQTLPFQIYSQSRHDRENGRGQSEKVKRRREDMGRGVLQRAFNGNELAVFGANSNRKIHCGFSNWREVGRGNLWGLLARPSGKGREGYFENCNFNGNGLQGDCFDEQEYTSMVEVVDIRDGECERVYDISVDCVHNFIANDILVHNCDEMDLKIFDASLGQPMSSRGIESQIVCSSTHHNPNGTMTEILDRAKKRGWPIYEWCYKENLTTQGGWLDPRDVDARRLSYTESLWKAEIELQEPTPEDRGINTDAVEAMFRRELGEYVGNPDEYIECEPPVEGGKYATGADWAKKRDWSVFWTWRIDVMPVRLVAFQRTGRRLWSEMIDAYDKQCERFKGASGYDETGVGNVVKDFMKTKSRGFTLTEKTKLILINNYIKAIEDGKVVAPMIQYTYGEHKFCSRNELIGTGHLPDSICSAAIAWQMRGGGGWARGAS